MTCILATPHYLAADRRVTDDEQGIGSMVKVAKNAHMIAASCGEAACGLHLKALVRKGAREPSDLSEALDKASSALVLLPSGRLWRVEHDSQWAFPPNAIEAIGSGGDLALGYVHGFWCSRGYWPPGKDDIRRALKFAASRRTDCGGGVDIRSFT